MNKQYFIDYPNTNYGKIRRIVINYALEHDFITHYTDLEFVMDLVEGQYYKAIWENHNDNSLLFIEYNFRLNSSNIHKYKHEQTDFINKGIE